MVMALKKLQLWGWMAILLLPLSASTQINPDQVMPVDPKVKVGRLSNGLTYYIRHNAKPEKRVELRLVVNAGSVLEDDDQLGLAHFMEHMNFNGTRRFPKNELVSYLQSIGVKFGADLNAYTGFDETIYILPVPTDKPGLVDMGLEILEDWAHNARLDSLEIEKERGVVMEEWRLSRGADERMLKQTLPVQFKGSQYANRLPIGNRLSLETFSHAALRRFYKDWYRPDLQAVIVVGDIDVNEMEEKIKSIFGDIPAPANPRKRINFGVPDHKEPLYVVAKDKETDLPSVELLYKKDRPDMTTIGDYCYYINSRLFTGMLNNRFRELTLGNNPPFLGALAQYGSSLARSKDAYQLMANCSDTGMARALSVLVSENRRVQQYGFTPAEFDLQKKQLQSFYDRIFNEREKEESFKYADEYGNNFLTNEPVPGIEWEYDFVRQYLSNLDLSEINKLAAQWITTGNRVVTLNAPEKTGVKIPGEEEVKALLARTDSTNLAPYQLAKPAEKFLEEDRLKPGRITHRHTDEQTGVTTLQLSNGATVILKPTTFKNDEILFRAFSKGGHSLVSDADFYSGTYAADIVSQSGAGAFSAVDIGNMLKGKSTSLTPLISAYNESLNGRTIPKETETMLQLVNLYFTAPRKDTAAFSSFITRQKQYFTNLRSNPQIYFSEAFQRIISQNHPRASVIPHPEDFDRISLDRSLSIYRERFANAGDFTFLFVGSFDEDSIGAQVEKYIGSLPGKPGKENYRDLGIRPPFGKIDTLIRKGSDPKAQVAMVFTKQVPYNLTDDYLLRSLGELLNIKLIETLREEKGGVYGVSSTGQINRLPKPYSVFVINFPCAPDNTDTLANAALNELKKIMANGVSATDLEKIKEQQRRKLELDLKENQYWLNNLYEASFYGGNAADILKKRERIDRLSSAQLRDAARRFIDTDKFIRVVLWPETEEPRPKPF